MLDGSLRDAIDKIGGAFGLPLDQSREEQAIFPRCQRSHFLVGGLQLFVRRLVLRASITPRRLSRGPSTFSWTDAEPSTGWSRSYLLALEGERSRRRNAPVKLLRRTFEGTSFSPTVALGVTLFYVAYNMVENYRRIQAQPEH